LASRSEFVWVLTGRVVTALVAIASLRVMTALLESAEFGIYALLVGFQGLFGLLLISPVGQHINRHTHAWSDDGSLFGRLAGYNKYLVLVSGGAAVAVMSWWLVFPDINSTVAAAILATVTVSAVVYFGTWNATLIYILNMIGLRGPSVIWMSVTSVAGLIASVCLAYHFHTGWSWLFGQAVGMMTGAVGARYVLKKLQAPRSSLASQSDAKTLMLDRQTVLSYCLPLAMATGLMWLQSTSYRFWVGTVWGIADLGLLALGLSVAAQLWAIVETLFMQLLSPYFFRHIGARKSRSEKAMLLSDLVNVVWPIYAILAGLNIYFSSSLLAVLADDKYHGAVVFVMWGVLIEFFRCTANLWSYAAQIEGQTRKVILPYALATMVLWSGLVLFCGRDGGVESLPAVLVGAGAVACVSMVLQMQMVLPVKLDIWRWLVSTLALVMCLLLSFVAPLRVDGLANNMGLLLLGLSIAAGVIGSLLRRNAALARLLSVDLQGD